MPDVAHFADIETEFISRVHHVVWCNMATVDAQGRPRSRIVHPIWEGPTGWIATNRHSFKNRHLAANPYVSLAYIADIARPVYVDCQVAWADDQADKQRVWDMFSAAPPPLGYDPAPFFVAADHPDFGVLRLTPWRIAVVTQSPPASLVWRGIA
jgi:general stress protein 26